MGPKRVMWVRRYQGQCRALRPLGHQGYRLRSYNKDQPLCSAYTLALGCSLTPVLRISFAGSPAWHGLPQCPGYGHRVSCFCVAFVYGSGLCLGLGFGKPASPGWGLGWVCLGTG